LVLIRIAPDEEGRFGFNVKGGSDLNMPILVSRVAPNTPADRCYPKLNEGDQVLFINNHDVSGMMHEQVVNLIRASRVSSLGELVLMVKPSGVYVTLSVLIYYSCVNIIYLRCSEQQGQTCQNKVFSK
jgi:tyrosine-protein phosphatase non-receptor type 4